MKVIKIIKEFYFCYVSQLKIRYIRYGWFLIVFIQLNKLIEFFRIIYSYIYSEKHQKQHTEIMNQIQNESIYNEKH